MRVLFAGPRPPVGLEATLATSRAAAQDALEMLHDAGTGDSGYSAAAQADGMLQRAEVARLAYLCLQVSPGPLQSPAFQG